MIMKFKTAVGIVAGLIGICFNGATLANSYTVNVMTFNVHYGVNAEKTNTGSDSALDQLVSFIKDKEIDVAFVQEFPHGNSHPDFKFTGERANHLAFIKSLLPEEYTVFEEVVRNGSQHRWGKSQLIIARLPKTGAPHIKNFPTPMGNMTRQIALLKVQVNGKPLWIGNTHPWHKHDGLNDEDLDTIAQFIESTVPAGDAFVWGGDMNFDAKKRADKYKKFTGLGYKDAYASTKGKYGGIGFYNTFVKRDPGTCRLDYLFYRNIASCGNYWRGASDRSDHYAVGATFTMK